MISLLFVAVNSVLLGIALFLQLQAVFDGYCSPCTSEKTACNYSHSVYTVFNGGPRMGHLGQMPPFRLCPFLLGKNSYHFDVSVIGQYQFITQEINTF